MRNDKKYYYPYARLDRESEVYKCLAQDAQRTGRPIAELLVIRCADYYAGVSPMAQAQTPRESHAPAASDVEANAIAAASAWSDEDI